MKSVKRKTVYKVSAAALAALTAGTLLAVPGTATPAQAAPVKTTKTQTAAAKITKTQTTVKKPQTADVYVLTKATIRSEQDPGEYQLRYDKNGRIKKIYLNYDKTAKTYAQMETWKYNASGLRTVAEYGPDQTISSTRQYAYSGNDQVHYEYIFNGDARKFKFDSSDKSVSYRSRMEYFYNKNNQVKKKIFIRYQAPGISRDTWSYKYTYNQDGTVKTEKQYDAKGVLAGRTRYSYDTNGNYQTIKTYDKAGTLTETMNFENTYNANGSLTKSVLATESNGESLEVTLKLKYKKVTVNADDFAKINQQQKQYLQSLQA